MSATVSVVITCYAEGALLLEAVRSASLQAPEEIVLVRDGGDHAETAAACEEAERRFKVRLIVRGVNGGTSASRNTGVSAATGEVIVPLDADDLLPEGALSAIRAAFTSQPDADFIVGPYWLEPASGPRTLVPASSTDLGSLLAPVPRSFSTAWRLLGTSPLRKSLFARVGGYDETFGVADLHDVEFWIRALKASRGAARTEVPLYVWRRALGTNTARVSVESWGRLARTHFETYRAVGLEYRARELMLLSDASQKDTLGELTQRWSLLRLATKARLRPLSLVAAAMPAPVIRKMASLRRRR